ncbi:ScbR family autoregulator-binding transcription factor [Streptomyces sp. NPDC005820]|uniref:ScbR family autoregulator-binding transcription factor n=1 Tax=Streptomyces sp. NPDC005820 TaxID=3157069 RepID=UPI0033CCB617
MPQGRALATQQRILAAAGELFAQHGYAETSLAEIESAAGVSRATLHHHFPSKPAVADAVLSHQHAVLVAPDDPIRLQALITLTRTYATALQTDPVLRGAVRLATEPGRYMTTEPYQGPINAVAALLSEARLRGELLPGVDPARSARFITAAYTGTQMLSQATTGRDDLQDLITLMWQHVLPALAHPAMLPVLHITPDH